MRSAQPRPTRASGRSRRHRLRPRRPRVRARPAAGPSRREDSHTMRLNTYLARGGIASRRGADELIKAGRVTVNGEPGQLNTFVAARRPRRGRRRAGRAAGARLRPAPQARRGRHDRARPAGPPDRGRPRARIPRGSSRSAGSTPTRPARSCSRTTARSPIGSRTRATGSRRSTRRRWRGSPPTRRCRQLAEGVELEDGRTAPARVRRLHRSRVELVLHEGRKHQVKRMLAAVGHPVVWLRRTRYAGLGVEGLEPGEWRELTSAEVECLRASG